MSELIYFRVSGRVQGVCYRASTQQRAFELQLTGWVRNCRNGDVEGVAGGSELSLKQFQGWLAKGPEFAVVSKLECRSICQNDKDFFRLAGDLPADFQIHYS